MAAARTPAPATLAHPPRRAARRSRLPRVTGALAAMAVTLAAGGCAQFDAALGKREAVVQFQPGTPTAVRVKVRAACSHVPQVIAEPLPTSHVLSAQIYDVRYEVGSATDAQVAQLELCLQRFPSVKGIVFEAPGGE